MSLLFLLFVEHSVNISHFSLLERHFSCNLLCRYNAIYLFFVMYIVLSGNMIFVVLSSVRCLFEPCCEKTGFLHM